MAKMNDEVRERFLAEPRYGILNTLRSDGLPIGVPVWFDWDGETVRMFTSVLSPKIKRIQADPRASLLVVNHPTEEEAWVSFDGPVSIHEEGGFELAEAACLPLLGSIRSRSAGDPRALAQGGSRDAVAGAATHQDQIHKD